MRPAWIAATFLGLAACQQDLPKASNIAHLRVLGASTEIVNAGSDDKDRTSPKPGETARMQWSIAFPDPDTEAHEGEIASLFLVCTAPKQFTGTPVCQELVDIAQGGSVAEIAKDVSAENTPDCEANPTRTYKVGPFTVFCVAGNPALDIVIPKDVKGTARLVQGVICRNGTPRLSRTSSTGTVCDPKPDTAPADRETIAVTGNIPIQYSNKDRNDNPNITEAAHLFFHDPPIPWQPTASDVAETLSDDTCLTNAEAMRVMHSEGKDEYITLTYDDAARELLADGQPEDLEFSAYTTFGDLNHRFVVFPAEAPLPLSQTFVWTLTEDQRKELNGGSKRVRFYFALMDHRGGFAITTRDLCVDRPK